ncbi:MAG: hypothetical protein IMY71_13500, partial [Bacteroidetes bacterium]|nr:hypothetical protein [Bacteroidota bacterium]
MTTKLIILIVISLQMIACENEETTFLSADIALYSDSGCWEESVIAAQNMFLWMGYTVELVNSEYINEKGLNDFKLLCIPGGDMYRYSQDLSQDGKKKIKNFINDGGSYIGICGGAYFASETVIWQGNQLSMTPLGLFQGSAEGTIDSIVPYPQRGMCQVNIVDTVHAITHSISTPQWILYYWGPVLKPKTSEVTILGKYSAVNQPAILAFDYGQGRVFITGTHPEIEEDSDRDGVTLK